MLEQQYIFAIRKTIQKKHKRCKIKHNSAKKARSHKANIQELRTFVMAWDC